MSIQDHKLGQAMQRMLEAGKRPIFYLDNIRITRAADNSVNPGALYIKNDEWDYIGKITSDGFMQIRHPSRITNEQKTLILEAIHEPERVAMSHGKATVTCCCCGRKLTNKLSMELGIGPICRGAWFPDSIVIPTPEEAGADKLLADLGLDPDLETLKTGEPEEYITPDILEDRLDALHTVDLELGLDSIAMEESIMTVSEPTINELITMYKALDSKQRDVFLGMIEKVEE